jgi:preprotein translocase subunit SecG
MYITEIVSVIFLAIAIILLIASFRDYLKSKGEKTIARRIWLRMALIFAAVAVGLYFLNHFLL